MRDGLYRSTFEDVVVMAPCLVTDTFLLKQVKIESEVAIIKCGQISSDVSGREFKADARPMNMCLGSESGGREAAVHPHDTYADICSRICGSVFSIDAARRPPLPPQAPFNWNVVAEGAFLRSCDYVVNCYIGAGSKLINSRLMHSYLADEVTVVRRRDASAARVKRYVVRKAPEVVEATITHCIMELGTKATDGCNVKRSVLMESASVVDQARVSESVLGPDASVGGGECAHSLMGPMTGFHHQCLVIATLWPMGRGNLAYVNMCSSTPLRLYRFSPLSRWYTSMCLVPVLTDTPTGPLPLNCS